MNKKITEQIMESSKNILKYKLIEILTLILTLCTLLISIYALNISQNTYKMTSVDYSPNIKITNSKFQIRLLNDDSDLFRIEEIEVLGENVYNAIVSVTEDYEYVVPFFLDDYYYVSSIKTDADNLDDVSIDGKNRISYYDEAFVEKYNNVIDNGLKKVNARLEYTTYKFKIAYRNNRNHNLEYIYLSYQIGYSGHSGGAEKISERDYENNTFGAYILYDNVENIEEVWEERESVIIHNMTNGNTARRPKR